MIQQTPIEEHSCGRRRIFVKRDDRCSEPPAPPLGKLRGLEPLLHKLVAQGHTTIGCWDTRRSKLGLGLAAFVRRFPRLRAVLCYPRLQNGSVPETIVRAQELGAEIVPMRGNHVSICFSQATKIVTRKGGVMIPFGMDCLESVDAVAAEARRVPAALLRRGTLVVSCGSGVTLAGLLRGLDPLPRRVIGVSAGRSPAKICACVQKYVHIIPDQVTILPAAMAYDSIPTQGCPFPTHPNYDLKAWKYLIENLKSLKAPLLFWNIGA